jgi:hypothetical protein
MEGRNSLRFYSYGLRSQQPCHKRKEGGGTTGLIWPLISPASVRRSAEPVEKVQMSNSDNFGTVKDQEIIGHRKPQNAQVWGFSTGLLSLFSDGQKCIEMFYIYEI